MSQGAIGELTEVTEITEGQVVAVTRESATLVTFRDGKVVTMHAYRTKADALEAIRHEAVRFGGRERDDGHGPGIRMNAPARSRCNPWSETMTTGVDMDLERRGWQPDTWLGGEAHDRWHSASLPYRLQPRGLRPGGRGLHPDIELVPAGGQSVIRGLREVVLDGTECLRRATTRGARRLGGGQPRAGPASRPRTRGRQRNADRPRGMDLYGRSTPLGWRPARRSTLAIRGPRPGSRRGSSRAPGSSASPEGSSAAGSCRHGSPRRPGHGGSPVGTLTPGTTGSTSLDGICLRVGDRDRRGARRAASRRTTRSAGRRSGRRS